MNQYWPRRSSPEGFSIEKLAKDYRDRISKSSIEEKISVESKNILVTDSNDFKTIHWANRDFDEYRQVA